MTFEEWNVPTEEKQWKVGALIECEKIANKGATARIIEALKAAMFEETNDPAYCEYCPACEAGECYGHTYDKYCHIHEEDYQRRPYEGDYPVDY
jgi:hypothetical protein